MIYVLYADKISIKLIMVVVYSHVIILLDLIPVSVGVATLKINNDNVYIGKSLLTSINLFILF